ncbi:ABC transporter permease subunit [Streptomyces sp. AS02]|uniref:carbohydrate ABC transporter permease n=1 Tax=Streptomyces sp. AS02 TaxID=2938946 RepID=UPI0027E4C303|nr:ABC transporter permease subunit [Streptomyces sp. AS02]
MAAVLVTVSADREMLGDPTVRTSMLVSLGITAVGNAISMVVSVLCAYGLSRTRSYGHRSILIITMFVSGGLIPTFLVVTGPGGYGQYWALILPGAVSVFNILVLHSFYAATSTELIDAARMDGAGDWRVLWSVVLPTSRAGTAVNFATPMLTTPWQLASVHRSSVPVTRRTRSAHVLRRRAVVTCSSLRK